MTEVDHAGPTPPPPPTVRHELHDENFRTILITAGILVACAIVTHVGIWGVFVYFKDREETANIPVFPLAAEESQAPLPDRLKTMPRWQPRLEGIERQQSGPIDVRPGELRGSTDQRLRTYGPAEPPEKGFVRVPIDVAMKRILEKGRLPVQGEKKQ